MVARARWSDVCRSGRERRLSPSAPYNRGDAAPSTCRCAAPASSARAWRSSLAAPRPLGGAARRAGVGAAPATTFAPMRSTPRSVDAAAAASRSGTRSPPDADDAGPRHASCAAMRRGAALEFSAWEQRVGELAVDHRCRRARARARRCAALRAARDARRRPTCPRRWSRIAKAAPRPTAARARRRLRAQRLRPAGDRRAAGRDAAASATSRASGSARPTCWRCCRSTGPRPSVRTRWSGRCRPSAPMRCWRSSRPAFEAELAAAAGAEVGALRLGLRARRLAARRRRRARAWCGPGWVLVGDAAHVVHPARRPGSQPRPRRRRRAGSA